MNNGTTVFYGTATPISGGEEINNQDITVTVNGEYTADEGYTGLGTVTVNVPNPSTGTLSVTSNGIYDVTNYASADVNVSGGGKYELMQRVEDDNGDEIGTVSGFFTDANGTEYAVVCLDAQYRSQKSFTSPGGNMTGMTQYRDLNVLECKDTATSNNTAILASGQPCDAVSYCRTQSFVIDSVTYYGQLPNCKELIDMFSHAAALDAADTTGYGAVEFLNRSNYYRANAFWASNNNPDGAWRVGGDKFCSDWEGYSFVAVPVLEIPNS